MPLVIPEGLVVGVSGFRGRVGDPLTPELVCLLATAFGAFVKRSRDPLNDLPVDILLGRDTRTSGPVLSRAVSAGLVSVGCNVVNLGIVSTPTLMLAVENSDALGGIAVTASHNPAEWNALKLAAPEGTFLDAETMSKFLEFALSEDPPRTPSDELGAVTTDDGASARHLEAVLELPQLNLPALRSRAFKVALDCVRGAGATIMPQLLEALGCEVVGINMEMDGLFPRDPEPTAENLTELADFVRREGADIGLAVDPDVDRLSLVNENGAPIGEDLTLALASAVVLRRTPGIVVTNLSTSAIVEDVARAHAGELVRSSVGEINVARRMQLEGAVVGGEGNGGVILPNLHHTRDAPVAAALVLQHLVDEETSLSAAVGKWPAYTIVKKKISFPREALSEGYAELERQLESDGVDSADGARFCWEARRTWLHVRPSGTEPVVRLIAEAPERSEAEELIERSEEILAMVVR
ncbi:MAG: phosphoglucosamine mutase [Gemmatimonadetes bacterium]|nr:phosphoglucosamine mutase [Gemmatimonadota bacterium]